jgi:hypothetical protein
VNGIDAVVSAARERRMQFHDLTPEGLKTHQLPYQPEEAAHITLVDDDPAPETGECLGPAAYSERILGTLLFGAQSVICSALMDERAGAMVAAMVAAAPSPRFVLVITQPQHHAAWARKIVQLSGCAPRIHVVCDGINLSELPVHTDREEQPH